MKLLRRPPRGLAQRISSPLRRPVGARGGPATELIPSVIGAGANLTAARRNDAIRHRAAEAERIADCNHPIADARIVIGEPDIGEIAAIDLIPHDGYPYQRQGWHRPRRVETVSIPVRPTCRSI
jgi:hypothetical protein